MYFYTFVQWLLFLYIYCFIGWVWESAYVSVKRKKLTNRGFMTGPVLPIYGFGAITVLLATIPVKHNICLVFCFGMIAATVLEYFTGVVMEAIFKVRYWDYSNRRFNLNGHICLVSSMAWGVFSILMIKVIHKLVERFVIGIPYSIQEISAVILSIGISFDFCNAVRDALDLKEMLLRMRENAEEMLDLQKRLNVLAVAVDDEKKVLKTKLEQFALPHKEDGEKRSLAKGIENLKNCLDIMEQAKQKAESSYIEHYKEILDEIDGMKERLAFIKVKMELRKVKLKKRVGKLLGRNPDVVSFEFEEALMEVKEINDSQIAKNRIEKNQKGKGATR